MQEYEKLSYIEKKMIMLYCQNDMNMSKAAKNGICDRTTIYYHFNKIKKKLGIDPFKFENLVKLYTYIINEDIQSAKEKQRRKIAENKKISSAIDKFI